jgi:hypothetical protein
MKLIPNIGTIIAESLSYNTENVVKFKITPTLKILICILINTFIRL